VTAIPEGSVTGLSPAARVAYRGFQAVMVFMALLGTYFAFRDTPSKAIQLSIYLGALCAIPVFLVEYERRKIESQHYWWDEVTLRVESRGVEVLSSPWSEIVSCRPVPNGRRLEVRLASGDSVTIDPIYHPDVRAALVEHLGSNASFPSSRRRSRKSDPKSGLAISLLFIPVFVYVSFSVYRDEASKSAIYAHPALATGEITHVDVRSKGQNVTYTFSSREVSYTNTQNIGRGVSLHEGEEMQVAFNALNPHNSILWFGGSTFPKPGIPVMTWILILFMPGVGVLLFATSLVQLLKMRRSGITART
jgi:4-amino-4-deoxy-L-arabinose transferase-like glycosyltransferase